MSEQEKASPAGTQQGAEQQTDNNLEATVKQLQAQVTRMGQENAKLQGQIEALTPYVQFGSEETASQPTKEPQIDENDPDAMMEHVRSTVDDLRVTTESKLTALEFMVENPDLKPHVDLVMTVLKSSTNPRKPMSARMKDAAEIVRKRLDSIRQEAIKEAEAQKKDKDAEAAAASAARSGTKPPTDSEKTDEGLSLEEYSAQRQQAAERASGAW